MGCNSAPSRRVLPKTINTLAGRLRRPAAMGFTSLCLREQDKARAAGGHARSRRALRGCYGRDPSGATCRHSLAGASRHAPPDKPGAQAPCGLLLCWPPWWPRCSLPAILTANARREFEAGSESGACRARCNWSLSSPAAMTFGLQSPAREVRSAVRQERAVEGEVGWTAR